MEKIKEKIAIIGAGNLGIAIAQGLISKNLAGYDQMVLTRRNESVLSHIKSGGFQVSTDNVAAVASANYVLICVQPKQLQYVLSEIKLSIAPNQVVISVITGVSLAEIAQQLPANQPIIRAMPNTAIAVGQSMTCLAADKIHMHHIKKVSEIFNAIGETLVIEERLMQAATVLGASGIAFFMRYLRAATQGGIQMGFHPEEAQKIAVQTAKGAAELIIQHQSHPEVEIDKVTTPQGCTIEGLNEMEHQGFSSALIKGLMTSYHKINTIRS